ncbi:LEA type 2 family protein [Marinomonas foliarum]|uniref:LEA14-like dessication related protein n=1 Tax=Marinomonas foliarum TaxID=491950 RepID=A0A368ZSF3_9GAMM|nr:LEA type 2 family protein [Marinomonas foliarum]RCW95820.1 LEA14-like dessication related protein [Marinomonas foliarum]
MFFRFIGIALIVLLSGCSALKDTMDVRKPTASVTGVSVKSVSTKSMTLLVEVKVNNPNSFDLKTADVDLDLLLNEHKVVKINQPDVNLSLPAEGSNSMRLPVTLMFDQILESVGGLPDKNGLKYVVKGAVVINLPVLGDFDVPVDYSGALSMPKKLDMFF